MAETCYTFYVSPHLILPSQELSIMIISLKKNPKTGDQRG